MISFFDQFRRAAATQQGRAGWTESTLRSAAEAHDAVAPVLAAMAAHGYSLKDGFAVRLALHEALVNAARHGNGDAPGKRVTLRYLVTADAVWTEVEDEGEGFDPRSVPDPRSEEGLERGSGRGLFLMWAYMTRVEYNDRGNRVLLYKRRDDDAARRQALEDAASSN